VHHSCSSQDIAYSTLSPTLCVLWTDDHIDSGCPTELSCQNGGICTASKSCMCSRPFGGRGCVQQCTASKCDVERARVTLYNVTKSLSFEQVRQGIEQAICPNQTNSPIRSAGMVSQCADFVSNGGLCPGLQVSVSEMEQVGVADLSVESVVVILNLPSHVFLHSASAPIPTRRSCTRVCSCPSILRAPCTPMESTPCEKRWARQLPSLRWGYSRWKR
jgi:hypothetical protein